MKMNAIVCAIAAASLGFGGIAFAQGGPNPPDDGRNAAANRMRESVEHNRADSRNDHRSNDRRPDTRNDYRGNDRRADNRYDHRDERGAGPDHRFYRGGRLPDQYRGRQYVVDDWRGHHLSAPPRGYHWVQTGGDYVLAAIATGIIASILINSH